MNKFYLDRDNFASGLLVGIVVSVVLIAYCSISMTARTWPFLYATLISFFVMLYYAFFEHESEETREKFGKYFTTFGFMLLMLYGLYSDLIDEYGL